MITNCGWNGITDEQTNALFKFLDSQISEGFIDAAFKMVVNGIKKNDTDCGTNGLGYFLRTFADRRVGGINDPTSFSKQPRHTLGLKRVNTLGVSSKIFKHKFSMK